MNLRQLEIFRAVFRYRTTMAAASELGLSQPAVSNAIKSIEATAGFPLFERINNRLHPTAEAKFLYDEADPLFAMHDAFAAKLEDLRENRSGRLRLVATPPLGYGILPGALKRFLARRSGTSVFFDVRRLEGVVDGIERGIAELGFALNIGALPNARVEPLFEGEMVCVCAPDHPLAALEVVTPADLQGLPLIGLERGTRLGEAVRQSYESVGLPYRFAVEVRYCNTACVLAESGVGVAIVDPFSPSRGGRHDLAIRPFRPSTPAIAYAIWSDARPLSRTAQAFLQEVKSESARLINPRAL